MLGRAAEPSASLPDPAQASLDAGLQALQRKDYGRAVEQLRAASELQPYWLLPHEYLAVAYHASGQEVEARAEYCRVQRASVDWNLAGQANAPELREGLLAAEVEAIFLVNAARLAAKLPPLRPDPLLAVCAREHSLEMWTLGYFDHVSPTPGLHMARDRFRMIADQECQIISENVGHASLSTAAGDLCHQVISLHNRFMGSPGHRANILSRDVSLVGVGLALDGEGRILITQDFLHPAREPRQCSD